MQRSCPAGLGEADEAVPGSGLPRARRNSPRGQAGSGSAAFPSGASFPVPKELLQELRESCGPEQLPARLSRV